MPDMDLFAIMGIMADVIGIGAFLAFGWRISARAFRAWRRRHRRFGGAVIPHERVTRRGCSRL
jgi:hypothetical protein